MPSGLQVDTDTMYPLTIEDVAATLAGIVRWRGLLADNHTVCSHSVNVALLLLDRYQHPGLGLLGLLHDIDEVFVGDIPAPLKAALVDEEELNGFAHRATDALLADADTAHALWLLSEKESVRAAVRCADYDVGLHEVASASAFTNAQAAFRAAVVGGSNDAFDGGCALPTFGAHSEEEFVNMFRNLVEQFNAARKSAQRK